MSLTIKYDFSTSSLTNPNIINNIAPITNPSQYNGFLYNNPTIGTSGNTSQTTAISLSNSLKQYIELPAFTTPPNGLSFAFWFNSNGNNKNARLFDFANPGLSDNILICFTDTGLTFYVQNKTIQYLNNINITNLNNTWNHIVWTLSPNPNIWNIYVNGTLTNTFNTNTYYPNSLSRTLQYIGKPNYDSLPYFNGSMSDFRIYFGNVLTQSQITALYNSDTLVTNNVYNELYNNIYCNLEQNDNGFIKCTNCNYGNQATLNTTTHNTEEQCLNLCNTTKQCTSYNYNTNNKQCVLHSDFPTHIDKNINNVNSGYSITKFGYDAKNLSDSQKSVIQKYCGSQYLNNYFTSDKKIDISSCLTINAPNSNTTNFSADPSCIYNIYNKNNIIPDNATIINSTFTDTNSAAGINPNSTSDPTIDNYKSHYKKYIDGQVAITNTNNNLENQNTAHDVLYNNIVQSQNDLILNKISSSLDTKLLEAFENKDDNKFIILVLIFIFLFLLLLKFFL